MIISGLPEGAMAGITENSNNIITSDKEKLCMLFKKLDIAQLSDDILENLVCNRIGKERPGFHRLVKVELPSIDLRNNILKNAAKLKTLSEVWSKIYIKKDMHPVYIKENRRLYKKMMELKEKPDYENKEVKIMKGKLLVDGIMVDKNTFFA